MMAPALTKSGILSAAALTVTVLGPVSLVPVHTSVQSTPPSVYFQTPLAP